MRISPVMLWRWTPPFFISVLLAIWLVGLPVQAQTPPPTPTPLSTLQAKALYERINVRSGPDMRYTRIGQVSEDDDIVLTGRSDNENNWLRIVFNGGEGWVAYFTVQPAGAVDQLPIVAAQNPQLARRDEQEVLTARVFRTVNVRSEPTITSAKVGQLHTDDEVIVLGRNSDENDWLLIQKDNLTGWVAYFTITLTGDVKQLDVISDEEAPTIPLMLNGQVAPVTVDAFRIVNVRSGPGMEYARVTQMRSGQRAAVTGRSDADNNWLQIELGGQQGWVAYFTVTVSGDINTLPIIDITTPTATPPRPDR